MGPYLIAGTLPNIGNYKQDKQTKLLPNYGNYLFKLNKKI
jgi:hypothetical protein